MTSASPAAGDVVAAGGFPLELRFNGRVDAARSRLTLSTADGATRKLQGKPGDGPSVVAAQVEAVPPGPCTLRYDVLSTDGHLTSGTITFTAAGR
ncbi:MAG: copper resistance CopC family protein [Bacteroidales bacterium]